MQRSSIGRTSNGALAPAIRDLRMRGSSPRLSARQARSARASPEASIAGSFLLQSMRILIEKKADHIRLSDPGPKFVCTACSQLGADIRPNFSEGKKSVGY